MSTSYFRTLLQAAPNLLLAIGFAAAWLAPHSVLAANRADGARVMVLEGILILASVLVGGFVEVAYFFFPLIMLSIVAVLIGSGGASASWTMACFAWSVIGAFMEGLRAHRGAFGLARVNPAHPHRRYDRVVLLYLGTWSVFGLLWIAGDPSRWVVWGAIYYAALTAIDTFLRDAFDRIPRALLRRMQSHTDPELAARLGICRTCLYVQPAIPLREGRYVRCLLSLKEPEFPEYPQTPLSTCAGHRPRDP